jgi:hypothetical protein
VKRACFTVANELVLDRELDLACVNVVLLKDVLKLIDDRVEDPGENDALHALSSRVIHGRGIREDVVDEVVVLQGEQNQIMLGGVAYRGRIQNT